MSRLTITSLPYADDFITNYRALSTLPGFALLESSDKQRGRYDIVTAYPYDSFTLLRNSSNIHSAFASFQSKLPVAPKQCDLPFQGGAIGYVAYDFGERMAGIMSAPDPANDIPLMDMNYYDWAIVTDHRKKKVDLVAANVKSETVDITKEVLSRWRAAKEQEAASFILQQSFTPILSIDDYQRAFKQIYQALIEGRAYQVNYTQPFLARFQGDPWELYQQVRYDNPVPYSAFLRAREADILCFSPEQFLSMDDQKIITSPIKGTERRSPNPAEDEHLRTHLPQSAKNRAENVMIVDLLRNDLGRIAKPGSVKVTSLCEVQSYNGVHHLVSTIEALCLDNLSAQHVWASCFPGGSITGAPKIEAMRIINEQEKCARGLYCGSIAYFSAHGRFDSNIAIRTITAQNNTMYLSAGGGIVIDSQWEDEYRECYTKIAAIVKGCMHR